MDATMSKLLQEIKEPHQLRHCEPQHDASAPHIEPGVQVHKWDPKPLLNDIQQGVPLKHVEPNDRSNPQVPADAHVGHFPHKEMMEEVVAVAHRKEVVAELKAVAIAAGGGPQGEDVDGETPGSALAAQLRHVGAPHDCSAPVVDSAVHVQKWDKAGFLSEVAAPHHLNHVDPSKVHDASVPAIDPNTHIGPSPQKALLAQIAAGELPALHHVQPGK